jgi:hypothetical protein
MKNIFIIFALLSTQLVLGQINFPIIKANSKKIAIKDGDYLDKNAWLLAPKVRPDIYKADRTRATKWITFYTDIDSIKVKVKPGSKFDFIVLLNGKDSCYTQIVSAIPPKNKLQSNIITHDTIPFILTKYNAIHVNSIINECDTLNLHFDVGSFDFHFTRNAILKKTKLLSTQPDAITGKVKPNFNNLEKIYKIQLGNYVVNNPDMIPTQLTAREMDGRFGWSIFEGKIVEIDYDKNLLIIHSDLPKKLKGYTKSKIKFIHSFVCIKSALEVDGKQYVGDFLFDTGSDQAMILDSSWVTRNNFPKDLKLIKMSSFRDPRGNKYENKIVQTPQLSINSFTLINVPATLMGSKRPLDFEMNYFGNGVLKRFNTILDFKNDCIYLKPNKLINSSYRENS